MPRTPKVIPRQLPNGKWHIDTTALGPRYRETWDTEALAIRDAERIKRQIAGVGLKADDLRGYDSAAHRLATSTAPGRGKNIDFVVDWFLTHYRASGDKIISVYIEDYLKRKKQKLQAKSMVEQHSYLDPFNKLFGHMIPSLVSADAMERYLDENTSRYYRDKVLRGFFQWLTGAASKRAKITKLEHPPLERNPFDFVERTEYEKQRPTEVLTFDEVMSVLREAAKVGDDILAWFVWLFFTGMRPEAEAQPFWTDEAHGWNQVHLDSGIICVTDDLEKTGTRIRDIAIQPNLRAWMDWFQAKGIKPRYSRRKVRAVLEAAVPTRNHQDLARHTFVSFLLKIEKETEVCYQAATSSRIVKKHYRRYVPPDQVAKFWGIIPASLGLL